MRKLLGERISFEEKKQNLGKGGKYLEENKNRK